MDEGVFLSLILSCVWCLAPTVRKQFANCGSYYLRMCVWTPIFMRVSCVPLELLMWMGGEGGGLCRGRIKLSGSLWIIILLEIWFVAECIVPVPDWNSTPSWSCAPSKEWVGGRWKACANTIVQLLYDLFVNIPVHIVSWCIQFLSYELT